MRTLTRDPFAELTAQERRVAAAVGRGATTKAVSRELMVSMKTVDFHLGNIYRKLGIGTRSELAHLVGRELGSDRDAPTSGGLPMPRGRLVGRDADVPRLCVLLEEPGLVTVLGPGGVGKTQLALTAARAAGAAHPDGAWFVDLASTTRPDDVVTVFARALGLHRAYTAREAAVALAGTRGLILLDSCEHVLDAVRGLVTQLLDACPSVTVLATSRERLAVRGEHPVLVGPLDLDLDDEGVSAAGRLFRMRCDAVADTFDAGAQVTIERMCARLDGLPLAIELAAARLRAFDLATLERGLDELSLAPGALDGADGRHSSLAATIAWSYRLLSAGERRAFEALSVFNGSFGLDAARAVLAGDRREADETLLALVDKCLVVPVRSGGRVRYRLMDTVREFAFALARANGAEGDAHRRFVQHAVSWIAAADADVRGPDDVRGHQSFIEDWHNVHSAIAVAVDLGDVDAASRILAGTLWWVLTRTRVDLDDWFERVLVMDGSDDHELRPVISAGAAIMAALRSDRPRALAHISRAFAEDERAGRTGEPWVPCIAHALGDESCEPLGHARAVQRRAVDPFWRLVGLFQEGDGLVYALNHLPVASSDRDRLVDRIRSNLAEAEYQRNPNGISHGTAMLGAALRRGDPDTAQTLLERAIVSANALGIELTVTWAERELCLLHAAAGRHRAVLLLTIPTIRRHLRAGSLADARLATAIVLASLVACDRTRLAARALGSLQRDAETADVLVPLTETRATIVDALGEHETARLVRLGRLDPIESIAREVADECERILRRPHAIVTRRHGRDRPHRR